MRTTPPAPAPASTPPPDDEDHGSHVMRFGAAMSAVVLSSVIATMPAVVRVAPEVAGSVGGVSVWLSLLALAFLPLLVATVTLRRALAAMRLFDSKALTAGVATAIVWGATTFVALAGLGGFLRATTHHHGLAGLTFACVGLFVAAVLALFAARFVGWCTTAPAPLRWAAMVFGALAIGVALAFFARVLGRSGAGSALAIDVVAFSFAAAFGGGAFPYRSRPLAPLAFAGPPIAAIVLVVGLGTLRRSPPLRAAVTDEVPVLAATLLASEARSVPPAASH